MMNLPSKIEKLATDKLVPYARNSRTHSDAQVAQIAASIREFGFTNPVLIREDNTIVAGHGRVMAAQQLGIDKVPCIRLSHLTDAQARAYVIADNKLALNAGWDEEMLAAELRALNDEGFDTLLTGFAEKEALTLIASVPPSLDPGKDPDEAPPAPDHPVTVAGDVWTLGRHRLICGDSTLPATYAKLLAGKGVDAIWTDPPYNVNYETAAGKIANDNLSDAEFRQFLDKVFGCMADALKPGAAIYVAHGENEGLNFRAAFIGAGLKLSSVVIWRKDSLVLGRADYQWIHEPILYGWKPGAAHRWFGGRKQTSVSEAGTAGSPFVQRPDGRWQITIGEEQLIVDGGSTVEFVEDTIMRELRPKRNDVHPTMKPVALIERMLRNSARTGDIVMDPFGGSGSTLMACEQLGMSARLIELDPRYCDVIVNRWQDYSGGLATRHDGLTFEEAAAAQDRAA